LWNKAELFIQYISLGKEDVYLNSQSKIYKLLEIGELEAVVKDLFGSRALLSRVQLLGGGLFNTTYILETTEPISKLVLRVAPVRQDLLFDFEKKMMSAEPLIYELLKDNNVPCPKVIKHDNTKKVISREYLITEYLEGSVTLDSPFVPEEVRPSLWFEVGKLTSKIHSINCNNLGWICPKKVI
jgi:aminoglycoside phosphotransferase (APT) family kinase protein